MTKILKIYLLIFGVLLFPQSILSQISEDVNKSGKTDNVISNDSVLQDKMNAQPKVHTQATLDNVRCDNSGQSQDISSSGFIAFRKKLKEIKCISRVNSPDSITQGFIIKTGKANSEVLINDTCFAFNNELYLITPAKKYKFFLKAKGQNTKYLSQELKLGAIEEIDRKLRPIRLNIGVTLGPTYIKDNFTSMGNCDIGMDIASKHFIGITGSILTLGYTPGLYSQGILNSDSSETLVTIIRTTRFHGIGLTYGYKGIHFLKVLTLIPKISLGYWETVDECKSYESIHYGPPTHYESIPIGINIHDLTKINYIEPYFFKPSVELQFGYSVIGFRINADMFIGRNLGPFGINGGILFRIL